MDAATARMELQPEMRSTNTEAAFQRALSAFDGSNFDDLTLAQKVLVTIWGIEAEVNNGGFDQYYFNSAGDQSYFAPEALRLIGASAMAATVRQANDAFGPDGPSRDRSTRQAQLHRISPVDGDSPWERLSADFQAYPEDLYQLVTDWLPGDS